MKKNAVTAILTLFSLAVTGCRFFEISPLTIVKVFPDDEIVDIATVTHVDVRFSADADKKSAEGAFSLLEDGERLAGIITWPKDDRLVFTPTNPLTARARYTIQVETSAEDTDGNSLEKEYSKKFRGTSDETRPSVIAIEPGDKAAVDSTRPSLRVVFSERMDALSVMNGFDLEPEADGYFAESENGTTFAFVLTEDLIRQTTYTILIKETARDAVGNTIGKETKQTFFVGLESIIPAIVSVSDETTLTALAKEDRTDATETVTHGIEKKSRITVSFSEPMDKDTTEANLRLTPAVRYDAEWNAAGDSISLVPSESYAYGAKYALTVGKPCADREGNTLAGDGEYVFVADGQKSAPPEIVRIDFLNTFTGAVPTGTIELGHLNSIAFADPYNSSSVIGFFDVYVRVAQTASIDEMDFIKGFTISASNVSVTPHACQIDGAIAFLAVPPNPVPVNQTLLDADPRLHVVRYVVSIDNSSLQYKSIPGDMVFTLLSSFEDTLGNQAGKNWVMRVNTTN